MTHVSSDELNQICVSLVTLSSFTVSFTPHHLLLRSIFLHVAPAHSSHSPSFCLLAYAVNLNTFPRGMTLNIILNFSFLISAASFTLNLLPRAKKQHGIHETCTHHRKCDYSLSISLSTFLSQHPRRHGTRETCSHLELDYFSFSLSCLLFLSPHPPPCSALPFNPFYFIFLLTRLARRYQSFSPYFNVSFSAFLSAYISLPYAQR